MPHELLKIGPHVTALPVVHGNGDFAWEVRRTMMAQQFDCLAVPLPESFQESVEESILKLPRPGMVAQREIFDPDRSWTAWSQASENADHGFEGSVDSSDSESLQASYVPIDPCQPVIAALRTAIGEHTPRRFIDLETNRFQPYQQTLPDAFALKRLPIERYAAAVLPFLRPDSTDQWRNRINHMAWQLRELSVDFKNILVVLSVLDWPWVRQAFHDRDLKRPEHEAVKEPESFSVDHDSLYFLLGELPLITGQYEKARQQLEDDEHLSIDGVKELLIAARESYLEEHGTRARKITPKLLAQCLKYTRNLTLIDHRFTPQLATIVTAAQQCIGDTYALHVLETAKRYPKFDSISDQNASVRMSLDEACFPDDEYLPIVSRLPGPPITWSNLELIPRPAESQREDWQQNWNPYSQCSWPPEDELIENFRRSVFDRAREVMGADLAKTEKFTTSVKDGIDIRETVRHWYEKQIYVKELPPARGKLDCAVMLFDSPADPRDYPWRTTWFAEHANESTLAFYATNFADQPVGPGICLGNYGGAMFIFPPVGVPDIWTDPRLDFASTLEERLLAAACLHSRCRHIALVSSAPPGIAWRQIARRFKKTWVHLPLGRFSDSTIQQLRMVHVLNGKEIRSYAANFIRRH
jgi:hypothetical protein